MANLGAGIALVASACSGSVRSSALQRGTSLSRSVLIPARSRATSLLVAMCRASGAGCPNPAARARHLQVPGDAQSRAIVFLHRMGEIMADGCSPAVPDPLSRTHASAKASPASFPGQVDEASRLTSLALDSLWWKPMHILHKRRCRVCGCADLAPVIDLGEQFLQGSFLKPPMQTRRHGRCPPSWCGAMCPAADACGLLQLAHSIPPEILYAIIGTGRDKRDHARASCRTR